MNRVWAFLKIFGLPLVAALITLQLAMSSFNTLEPGQVMVRLNNITGTQESITQPGFVLAIPVVHTIYDLTAAPQTFLMKGEADVDNLHVRELTVRANDGSNFHFDEFTLVFGLSPSEAVAALRDGGADNGFLYWMKPYVRSVLRSEFGRESTIDVANPSSYKSAAERAKQHLNKLLGPHGIVVTQIVTPRPKFNPEYEAAIERRNALGNELEVIKSNLARAETERERTFAGVDQEQNRKIQERRAELEAELAKAIAQQAETKREADTYRISKIAYGQAAYSGAVQEATQLKGKLQAQLAERRAEINAFRNQSIERVMEQIGKRLVGVTVSIQPYADDATPSRLQITQN
jgi:membrane protease subunit HflC